MANPQWENGYTKIANEIMEALARFYMPSNHWRCFIFIIRHIYGHNEKFCVKVSNSEIAEATGIMRHKVSLIMNDLIYHNVLVVTPTGNNCDKVVTLSGDNRTKIFEFNKDYDAWTPFQVVTPTGNKVVTSTGNKKPITPYYKNNKAIICLRFKKNVPISSCINKKTGLFPITEEMKKYAESKGYKKSLEDLTESFTIHHQKKGSKFTDWHAAWQTWLRNEIKWNGTGKIENESQSQPPIEDLFK